MKRMAKIAFSSESVLLSLLFRVLKVSFELRFVSKIRHNWDLKHKKIKY